MCIAGLAGPYFGFEFKGFIYSFLAGFGILGFCCSLVKWNLLDNSGLYWLFVCCLQN